MGMKGKESTSNALAIQLDAQGKVKYDLIARQGHGKEKVSFNFTVNTFWSYKLTFLIFLHLFILILFIDCVQQVDRFATVRNYQ